MTLIQKDLKLIRDVVRDTLDESFNDPQNPLRKDIYKIRDELKAEIRKIGGKVEKLEKIHPAGRHQSTI